MNFREDKNSLRVACILPGSLSGSFNIPLGEPLGLLYIAGVAKNMGCEIEIFIREYKETCEKYAERISNYHPNVLAFSVVTCQADAALKILSEIKKLLKRKYLSIAGGIHPTLEPEYFLKNGFDICVVGEGEEPFGQILHNFSMDNEVKEIEGIAYNKGDRVIVNPRYKKIDLDELPLPLRNKYLMKGPMIGSMAFPNPNIKNWASILTSRGCPNHCFYCCWPSLYQGRISWRSPKSVVDEMIYLAEKYEVDFFRFDDASFNVDPKYTLALCKRIINSGLKASWYCMANVNNLSNEAIICAMKEAGCSLISIGIESTNPITLSKIGKASINSKALENLSNITKHGIATNIFYMIGFPWQTAEMIEEELEYIKKLDAHKIQVFVATPYPKTPFWAQVRKELYPNNYERYDSEHLVFKHKYLSEEDIDRLRKKITEQFYMNRNYKNRIKSFLSKYPKYRETFLHYWKTLPFWEKLKIYMEQDLILRNILNWEDDYGKRSENRESNYNYNMEPFT